MTEPTTVRRFNPSVSGALIQGSRSDQQDSFRIRRIETDDAWLFVLADGMGGHTGGEIASKIAVDTFVAKFVSLRADGADLAMALQSALTQVNDLIARTQTQRPDLTGMGTTLIAAHLSRTGVRWISVGDSALWLLRDGALQRLNEDHSLKDPSLGRTNILHSALNGKPTPLIDCKSEPVALQPGDHLLAASDGIFTLDDPEIVSVIQASAANRGAEGAAQALLDRIIVHANTDQDNCCVIVATGFAQSSAPSGVVRTPPAERARSSGRVIAASLTAVALAGLFGLCVMWILEKL